MTRNSEIYLAVLLLPLLGGCYDTKTAHMAIEAGIAACKERGGVPSTFVSPLVARVDCATADVPFPDR